MGSPYKSKNLFQLFIVFLMIVAVLFIFMPSFIDPFLKLILHRNLQEAPKENSVLVIQQYPSKQEVFKNNLLIIIKSALK
ncbi:hypothetical protein HNQ80_002755 [Anaerosolibacter carboniphilus]|uniref:Uncharacterized protein n=1 Tax=Anaerosolibacter carboniphilus TaxID=1417629 RepID=A0A841KTB0_9FIRM|nr:hypothetical protein [Anaerosolibacter carboniphilus]